MRLRDPLRAASTRSKARRRAWELARGTATLANTPYDLQRVLESRYAEADRVRQNDTAFLDHLEAAPTEDRPNFYFIASAVSSILGDVVAAENRLQTATRSRSPRSDTTGLLRPDEP